MSIGSGDWATTPYIIYELKKKLFYPTLTIDDGTQVKHFAERKLLCWILEYVVYLISP